MTARTSRSILLPKLASTLKTYDRRQFGADLMAGVVVGIVALPLSIAFAIASSVTLDRGLYTAVVAGFLVSALGGSRVQIGGPTGAFVVIVYGIVQKYGVEGLTLATFLAGGILVAFGLARPGAFIRFVPHPLITGFTAGIAVIIASGQIKDALGIRMGAVPAEFFERWATLAAHASTLDAAALTFATIAIVVAWPRVNRRIPGPTRGVAGDVSRRAPAGPRRRDGRQSLRQDQRRLANDRCPARDVDGGCGARRTRIHDRILGGDRVPYVGDGRGR